MKQAGHDRAGERGAVFVEKLIVYLPLMMAFFAAWELAELGAASIVVQRASATAGRAAMVVLADDPTFYEDEPVGSYDGMRKADIELAAGMILAAIPRFSENFTVELEEPSGSHDPIEVTVSAEYSCGLVSMVCGEDDAIELTSTTAHTYQGAKYPYTTPALGGGGAALTNTDGSFRASSHSDGYDEGAGFRAAEKFNVCKKLTEAQLAGKGVPKFPAEPDPNMGDKLTNKYAAPGSASYEALKYRCLKGVGNQKNVAVAKVVCEGMPGPIVIAAESGWDENPDTSTAGTPENWDHSEQNILRKLQRMIKEAKEQGKNPRNCKITDFYTERDPCYNSGGASCQDFFNSGGTNLTKAPDVKMSPAEIKKLKEKISFHYEYNNNFRQFDKAACDDNSVTKTPQAKAFCKKLKDNEKACKDAGGNPKQSCEQMEKGFNKKWKQEQNADEDYKKKHDKWKEIVKCHPQAKEPQPPDKTKFLKEGDVNACLEMANIDENLNDPSVRNTARDDIAAAMKAQCDKIRKEDAAVCANDPICNAVFEPRPATPNPIPFP